jgi:hypothetical protein
MSHPILPKGLVMSLRPSLLTVTAVVLAMLVGCAPSSAPTPEPTPAASDPTSEQLIAQFADALCPAVAADVAFNEVWEDQAASLDEIVAVATAARDEGATAAQTVESLVQSWPVEYENDLQLVRDLYVGKSADYAEVADASTLDELIEFQFIDVTEGNNAAQRIADALGAPQITC